jgi:adenine deaminase
MFLEGSKFKTRDGEDLRNFIEAASVDQAVMCSDLGQTGVFGPIEGFRRGIRLCIDLGYDDDQIQRMASSNAARMLGIEVGTQIG